MLSPSRCHAELVSASSSLNSQLYPPNSKQTLLDIFNNHDILHLKINVLDSSLYRFQEKNLLGLGFLAILPDVE
jgi:hypothetical protein